MERQTRVLIADDQALYREGLRKLMKHWPEFIVVGEASSGRGAIDFCRKEAPDMVLVDVQMRDMYGVDVVRAICENHPDVLVVALTISADDRDLFGALHYGARGYILKDVTSKEFRTMLQGVVGGGTSISPIMTRKVVSRLKQGSGQALVRPAVTRGSSPLSEREVDLLRLVAEGLSNEEIGERLYLSASTVKKQLSSLMQKLCLENRVQTAVYAARAGLLD